MRILRRAMVGAVAAVLAAGTIAVVSQSPAEAHGAVMIPGSRNYLCWLDALTPQGNLNPTNPACRDALTQGGDQAYYNWFGSLRSDGGGRTRGFIPDSAICNGGNAVFAGMSVNSTSTAWPETHLTAGATIGVRYNKWAAHPGFFRLYVTRDSWASDGQLTWDDIEGIPAAGQPVRGTPFDEVQNPPDTGPVGSVNGYYFWNARLPSNKSGRHLIFSVWARTDSQETFYNCSNVNFDGGNGQVTGVGNPVPPPPPAPNPPPPPPPAPNPPPPPPPAPNPPPPPPPGPQPPPPPGGCSATWSQASRWSTGYTGMVTVRNTGTAAISGWTVTLNIGSDTIANMWSGIRTGNTGTIPVRNESYNGNVAANGTTSFGFQANGSGTPTVTCSTG